VSRDGVVLAEAAERESRSHTLSLPRLIERVLAAAGLGLDGVEAVAVSIGPGSFTGLRIGLALGKGLAYAGGIPLIGIPTLEALAHVAEAAPGETICTALDARKQEVYAALFEATVGAPRRLEADRALAPGALAARLPPETIVVGDATEVYGDSFGPPLRVRPFATHHPRGGVIARLGAERLAAGAADNAGTLEPVYVRPPEAELQRWRRSTDPR